MNSKHPTFFLSSFSPIRFLLYTLVIFLTSTVFIEGNETDHEALLKIKLAISDPYGALNSWDNNSPHFCNWTGVTCGKRHRRVTKLQLKSQGLDGSLSPHVGNLSFLRTLFLANNSFRGTIPHELGRLSRLRFLNLSRNKFNGAIPANISGCSKLEELSLSINGLVGSIPKELSFLFKLVVVHLGDNKLTGGLPSFLGNITSIEKFSVTRNPLGGSIPDTIGNWKNLREFNCSFCNLYGKIPRSLYNLSLLQNISLSSNHLTGSLPLAIGAMLPHLIGLRLWHNQLTGPLPTSISNCSRLRYLDMGDNKFSGMLMVEFGKLKEISYLRLSNNLFGSNEYDEMKFIDSLGNCTRLRQLHLHKCNFQGMLPTSIGNLTNQLQKLYLFGNQLHGNIPSSIGNLVGLDHLRLNENQFTGNVPLTIGSLPKIQVIHLYKNQLSGQMPEAIGNLSLLSSLDLSSNMLEGVIPSSLGNCHSLLELNLNNNKLNGKIPTQLLQLSSMSIKLNLSRNKLSGSLPPEVGHLNTLAALDLSHNNFSSNIPSSLGGCASLSWLSLKGNLFQGMIPPSLSLLKGLQVLDVSHNNLSGQIPRFLERLIGLEYLNLSYNDFEGEVPMRGVFANASAFSVSGNSKLCGGFVEPRLPKCKETKKHTKTFPLLVTIILIVSALFIIICFAYVWCKKKSKNQLFESSTSDRFIKVSYNQLLNATNGFSEANLIGNGGFSSVYKGILDEDDDTLVAVKVLHLQSRGAQKSFIRECETWKNIRHKNLLKIITSCSSVDFQGNDFKALIYEFMPNGSLHDWLHSSESTLRLNLLQIISILLDVACALDYIHNSCLPAIVHGDLKPSNILLDNDMVAHVGDFGLARFIGTSHPNSSTGMRGTIGYAAPEYGLGSKMTSSGDVYSYGILLLEVMSGKTPTDEIFIKGLNLHTFASMALQANVIDVIDVNILNIYQDDIFSTQDKEACAKKINECLTSTIKIGVQCSMDSPSQRMDMKKVVHELQHIACTLQSI